MALVFEFGCADADGNPLLVVARPGLLRVESIIEGVGGHIRTSSKNVSAAELAIHLAAELFSFARSTPGLSFNLYSSQSETSANVLPIQVKHSWEVRSIDPRDMNSFLAEIENAFERVKKVLGVSSEGTVTTKVLRQSSPVTATDASLALAASYQTAAKRNGIHYVVGPEHGGLSDSNQLQTLGIPIIDNIGAFGDGAHTNEEFVVVNDIATKALIFVTWIRDHYLKLSSFSNE